MGKGRKFTLNLHFYIPKVSQKCRTKQDMKGNP